MIFWKSWGFARPVRTVAKSSFATSTALCMRVLASDSTSAITGTPSFSARNSLSRGCRLAVADHGPEVGAEDRLGDVAGRRHAEDLHRHVVVHAEAEGGRVDDLEAALQRLLVRDAIDLVRVGIRAGIVGV